MHVRKWREGEHLFLRHEVFPKLNCSADIDFGNSCWECSLATRTSVYALLSLTWSNLWSFIPTSYLPHKANSWCVANPSPKFLLKSLVEEALPTADVNLHEPINPGGLGLSLMWLSRLAWNQGAPGICRRLRIASNNKLIASLCIFLIYPLEFN